MKQEQNPDMNPNLAAPEVGNDAQSLPDASTADTSAESEDTVDAFVASLLARAEAEGLLRDYPDFDPAALLADLDFGPLLRGEGRPCLRRLYEAANLESVVEARVQARLQDAVNEALAVAIPEAVTAAVTAAVTESEERLLGHIRSRGQRPGENGTTAAAGIRLHPAVERLSRRERALLAERAGRGETVRL